MNLLHASMNGHKGDGALFKYFDNTISVDATTNTTREDSEGWHGDCSHCITQTNKYFLVGGLDIHAIIIQ